MATTDLLEREETWLNLTQAAELLALAPSTLSRHAAEGRVACVSRGLGRGEILVPPAEVLRLAHLYRRVPLEQVLSKLARAMARRLPESEDVVEACLRGAMPAVSVAAAVDARREGRGAARKSRVAGRRPPEIPMEELPIPPMPPDLMPSPTLLQALDMRNPFEWDADSEIEVRKVRVVDGGKLEPWSRF